MAIFAHFAAQHGEKVIFGGHMRPSNQRARTFIAVGVMFVSKNTIIFLSSFPISEVRASKMAKIGHFFHILAGIIGKIRIFPTIGPIPA